MKIKFTIVTKKDIVFIEDYAFLINAINDLSDITMNFKYNKLARKLSLEAMEKFFLEDKQIFQKSYPLVESRIQCASPLTQ